MTPQLELDLLRCFVSVIEAGALTRAALRLGRSQAAVSQQMVKLETIVGKPLLHRTGRGVSMTVHGERLLSHARGILRMHDEALAELSGTSIEGTLRLGCPDDYANAFLSPLLKSFAELHPRVSVEVVCASTPRLLGHLDRNGLDLALISVAKGSQHTLLRREQLVWVAPKDVEQSDLPNPLRLALGDPDALDHLAALKALEDVGREYSIAYSSGSLSGLLAVARSGQAIAVLTRAAVPPDFRILGKAAGLPPLPSVGLTVQIDAKRASTLAKAFEEHVRARLPSL